MSLFKDRRFVENGGGGGSGGMTPAELLRLQTLENNEYKVAYYASVSSDAGAITVPTGATILLNQFAGGVDAYVSTIDTGQPTGQNPLTAGGVVVDVSTFDAVGNYTLTGVPSAYPVAIIYILKIPASVWVNLTLGNVVEYEQVNKEDVSNKQTDLTASATKYPTVNAVNTGLALKSNTASPTFTGTVTTPAIILSSETASTIASFDASKNVKSLALSTYPSLAELAHVKGVTSAVQTQFTDNKVVNTSYRTILDGGGWITAGVSLGTFMFTKNGGTVIVPASGSAGAPVLMYIDPADYPTVNGVTTKLRIRSSVLINNTAPTNTLTFALYPVTATAGGVGIVTYTLGGIITGSDGATIAAPAANSQNNLVGSDFDIPAAGFYVVSVQTSVATAAVNSYTVISFQLQMRN